MMKICLSIRTQRMRDADDSGAAMITALLAILVTAMFSIVMLGVIMSQITPTRLEQATTQTVYAAETGINVDRVPGPRGPVTYRDLWLRQYRVLGDGTQKR